MNLLAAGVFVLAGQGLVRADGPAVLRAGDAGTFSHLKFTGDVQTDDICWRRGYCGFRRGYGYGYSPYYASAYYSAPYYPAYSDSAPYYGTAGYGYAGYAPYRYYGRPYYRGYYGGYGYRRIDLINAPPASNLGTVTAARVAPVAPITTAVPGPIRLTQYVPYVKTPGGMSVTVQSQPRTTAPSNQSYPYNGGPRSIVPLPGEPFAPTSSRPRASIPSARTCRATACRSRCPGK